MSDFLDRLAARAIGSETMLAPRLPSLFESPQSTPIMPLTETGDARARDADKTPDTVATPAAVRPPSAHAVEPIRRSTPHVMSPDRRALSEPVSAVAIPRDVASPPAPVASAVLRGAMVECSAEPVRSEELSKARTSSTVQPRQTRIEVAQPEAKPVPVAGSLWPAPEPVFSRPRASSEPVRPGRASGSHGRAAPPGSRRAPASESVVHVSIGRLEVRAAPSAAAPSRRRPGPQPASLDDYLRQRGDKASP
ncbi:MAG TPA: hypothetical protein VFE77_17935 [Rhodanobacter sp.]|nr:hypothetical protein [Rhodanobacter sp.]